MFCCRLQSEGSHLFVLSSEYDRARLSLMMYLAFVVDPFINVFWSGSIKGFEDEISFFFFYVNIFLEITRYHGIHLHKGSIIYSSDTDLSSLIT